jgi:amidase
VLNPHNRSYLAGGSSGGSAAAVVNGDCDITIGGDQGGSIRIPSSWCGAYGLKPTKGLVPYTGVFPIEASLDHVGPIASTTYDVALCLEVIAGKDDLDPRQASLDVKTEEYTKALSEDVSDLRFGVVKEGFDWNGVSQPDVDKIVREATNVFRGLGAKVTEVSIPLHREGIHIWYPIILEGSLELMIRQEAVGANFRGYYDTNLLNFYSNARRVRKNDYPLTVKLVIILGEYMARTYRGEYYAKAQNISRDLTEAYDNVFEKVDLLVMPTTPMKAMPYVRNQKPAEYMTTALGMIHNTCPFDVTGHPAMNVPCGMSEGLPVGMMLVGRHWHDAEVLRASYAFERVKKGYSGKKLSEKQKYEEVLA